MRRSDSWALLFLVILVLLFFRDLWSGDDVLVTTNMSRWMPWTAGATWAEMARPGFRDDSAATYYPRRLFSSREIAQGHLPLWNHFILCGTPHLADFQSGVFHPLNLLLTPLDPATAQGIFVVVHLLLGGVFFHLFLRRLGVGSAGSLLGALSFLWSAHFAIYHGQPPQIATAAYAPLILLLTHKQITEGGARLLPLAVALTVLGGFPETIFYSLTLGALFGVFLWLTLPGGGRREGGARLLGLAGLLAVGVGITLVQLLPTAELAGASARKVVPLSTILGEAQPSPHSLIRVLLPDFFGNPVEGTSWIAAFQGSLPHPNDLGFIGYAGVLPFFLAVGALLFSRRKEVAFFAAAAAVTLLLLFSSTLFGAYYHLSPLARFSSAIHRLQFPFILSIAALAGMGIDEVRSRAARGPWRGVVLYVAAVLLLIPVGAGVLRLAGPRIHQAATDSLIRVEVAEAERGRSVVGLGGEGYRFLSGRSEEWMKFQWKGYGRFALLLGIGAVPLLFLRRTGPVAGVALLFTLASVAADGWLFSRMYYTPQPRESVYAEVPSLQPLLDDPEPFRIARVTGGYLLPANTALPYGLEDVEGVNALQRADYGDIFRAIHPALFPDGRRVLPLPAVRYMAYPIWDLLNVKYFLVADNRKGSGLSEGWEEPLVRSGRIRILSRSPFTIAENLRALPRAFLRHAYYVEKGRGEILTRITADRFDPEGPLLLEEKPPLPSGSSAVLPGDRAELVSRKGATATFRTESTEAGLLFLSESYDPGWVAEVDGARTPIYRANYAFRAVPVPAGEHQVVFRYRPRSLTRGAVASLVFLGVYGVLLGTGWPRRRLSR